MIDHCFGLAPIGALDLVEYEEQEQFLWSGSLSLFLQLWVECRALVE